MPEINYASRGLAGTALGVGIGGLVAGLANGGLANIFNGNGNGNCHENTTVNRYELSLQQENATLRSQIALRDANTYSDQKLLEVYKYVDAKFATVEKSICEQAVFNATTTTSIGCIANQVNQLMALTKLVIPIGSICPTPATATTTA